MIRLKEALKKLSNGQLTLCKKGQILFEASNDVIDHIPEISMDLTSDEIQELKYTGTAATTQIVIRTKEKMKHFAENNEPNANRRNQDANITSGTTSPLPSSPPAYEDCIHRQQPAVNPYYQSSPNVSYGYGDMVSPNVSGLVNNSPGGLHSLYPDLSGTTSRGLYDSRRNSFHGDAAAFT